MYIVLCLCLCTLYISRTALVRSVLFVLCFVCALLEVMDLFCLLYVFGYVNVTCTVRAP